MVFYYKSAIDIAIKEDQAQGLFSIVDYITKFQNNFQSSYLLQKTLPKMI